MSKNISKGIQGGTSPKISLWESMKEFQQQCQTDSQKKKNAEVILYRIPGGISGEIPKGLMEESRKESQNGSREKQDQRTNSGRKL